MSTLVLHRPGLAGSDMIASVTVWYRQEVGNENISNSAYRYTYNMASV